MASLNDDIGIVKNLMISNEATHQDPSSLRQSQRAIKPPSLYLLIGKSKQMIFAIQVDDSTLYSKVMDDVDTYLLQQAQNVGMYMYDTVIWIHTTCS